MPALSDKTIVDDAPDTVRDQDVSGATEPLDTVPDAPPAHSVKRIITKPLGVRTKPLEAPIQKPAAPIKKHVATKTVVCDPSIAPPPPPMGRPSFEVYGADDTYAGKHPAIELPLDTDTERQYKIGLGVFGALVVLVTSLAAIGSCDDKPTPGSVETTAATVSAAPSAAASPPSASVLTPTAAPTDPAETPSAPPLPPAHKKKKKH